MTPLPHDCIVWLKEIKVLPSDARNKAAQRST
jgi:hypothetical protein